MVSHCETFSAREDYVEELQKYLNVSIYGSCNNNPYDSDKIATYEMTSKNPIL